MVRSFASADIKIVQGKPEHNGIPVKLNTTLNAFLIGQGPGGRITILKENIEYENTEHNQ